MTSPTWDKATPEEIRQDLAVFKESYAKHHDYGQELTLVLSDRDQKLVDDMIARGET